LVGKQVFFSSWFTDFPSCPPPHRRTFCWLSFSFPWRTCFAFLISSSVNPSFLRPSSPCSHILLKPLNTLFLSLCFLQRFFLTPFPAYLGYKVLFLSLFYFLFLLHSDPSHRFFMPGTFSRPPPFFDRWTSEIHVCTLGEFLCPAPPRSRLCFFAFRTDLSCRVFQH